MKLLLLPVFLIAASVMSAQSSTPIGIFQHSEDIGNPKLAGSSYYDDANQVYTLKGAGYNIWFERDEFHYLNTKLKGDFILTANFEFVGEGVDPHRKIGWMIRPSNDEKDAHVSAVLHGDGLTVLQWRVLRGAFMRDPEDEIFPPKSGYSILQVERVDNEIIFRAAHQGEPLQLIGSYVMDHLPEEILAGLFICSHNPDVVEEARVWNVRITQTVPKSYNAYSEGQKASRLETMNVFNGKRKVIYEGTPGFEAPNWTLDGKNLIFNRSGSIFKIPVTGGEPQKINTDFADRNNNDHGISFDGKTLAISHHRDGLPGGGSSVYVVPVGGGTPKLVTEETPSYWHGWHPNNKEVIYVAQREEGGPYNLYKKSIKGGKEVRLTDNKGSEHTDGCEFSPDGEYIYYNGSHTGTMQIWRMKADGSGREQITFDEYNDWFPHISPDGKWMVFLSFVDDIDTNDHPFYKRVMLRMMPVNGGAPRVIAYLYGGQGTINVPSWSPDSKHISFVSNIGN